MGLFSSWGSTFNTLGHINNTLGTVNNYIDLKNQGATTGQALANSAVNGTVGAARVEYASERYDRTGSMSGHVVNTLAGYGNLRSNVNGAIGLAMTDPSTYWGCRPNFFMGGGMRMPYSPFGCSAFTPMPMALPMFGGCGCNSMPFVRGSYFMGGGFFC